MGFVCKEKNNVKIRMILATAALTVCTTAATWAQQPAPDAAPGGPGAGAPATGQAPGMGHGPKRGFAGGRSHRGGGFGPGAGEDRAWWKIPAVVKELGLTPDQVKKLDDLSLQSELNLIQLRATVETDEVLLRATLDAPKVDEPKADAQIDKVAEAHAAVEKAEAHRAIALRKVLTDEQWAKMHEEREEMDHQGPPMGSHRGTQKHGGPSGAPQMPPPPQQQNPS